MGIGIERGLYEASRRFMFSLAVGNGEVNASAAPRQNPLSLLFPLPLASPSPISPSPLKLTTNTTLKH